MKFLGFIKFMTINLNEIVTLQSTYKVALPVNKKDSAKRKTNEVALLT
jgi:hypothetical protein